MITAEVTNKQLVDKLARAQARVAELEQLRQNLEKKLQNEQDNTRQYLDLAEVILVALDAHANITMIGGKGYELLGYEAGEIIGKNWFKVCLPPDDCDQVLALFKKLMAGELENTEYYENSILTKFNEIRYIAWHNKLLTDNDGRIIGTISSGIDITERIQTERALRNSEANFRTLTESANVGILVGNQKRHLFANPALLNLLGYTQEEFVHTNVRDIVHPDEVGKVLQRHLDRQLGKPVISNYETVFITKDGRSIPVELTATVASWRGEPAGLVFVQDITERQRTQNALRASEQKYRQLFENMSSGFALHEIICDEQGKPIDYRYLELNPGFEKQTGVPASALLGKTIREVMPNTEDYWIEIFGKVALTGEPIAYENYSRELGKYYETWVFSPQKNQFAVIFSDITERKKAQEELPRQKNEQQQIINTMVEAVISIDEEGIIQTFSNSAQRMFGYSAEDIIGHNIKKLMPTSYADQHDHYLSNYLSTNEPHIIGMPREVIGLRQNGETFPLRLSVAELQQTNNGKRQFIGSCYDITVQKQQEEQLRRSQKMDALGKLTGGIAHDYNNMLGVILGYTHLLQEALVDDPKLSKYIDEIQHASERGTKLSRKLLAFASNKQNESNVADINAILTAEQDLLQKTLTPRIELQLDLFNDIWPIRINSGDFEDVLLNLSINAMHAMEESGGKLTISTRNQHLNVRDVRNTKLSPGDYVQLTLTDTGCGMDTETRNKIFDPFFTTKGDKGIGLGLSMVYGFCQRCGGDISVESKPGKGSRFTLYFPRQTQIPSSHAIASVQITEPLHGNETILAVDDELAMVNLAKEILSAKGYKVLTAGSGEQALEVLSNNSVDLLLSDVIMPGMDGYQLAEQVRQRYPAIGIQLVSGYAKDKTLEIAHPDVKQNLLYKPFTAHSLLQRVRELLDQQKSNKLTANKTVMVMDDDENMRKLFRINLEKLGYKTVVVSDGESALKCYQQSLASNQPIDVSILDLHIQGGMDGIDAAQKILALNPQANLVVCSGDSDGKVVNNYQQYGFKGSLDKTFDRHIMAQVLNDIISKNE